MYLVEWTSYDASSMGVFCLVSSMWEIKSGMPANGNQRIIHCLPRLFLLLLDKSGAGLSSRTRYLDAVYIVSCFAISLGDIGQGTGNEG